MCVCVCVKREWKERRKGDTANTFMGGSAWVLCQFFHRAFQQIPIRRHIGRHWSVETNGDRGQTQSPKWWRRRWAKVPVLFCLSWIGSNRREIMSALLGGLIKGTPRKSHGAGHDIHRDICVSALLSSRARAFRPR